ncbi:MAG: carboxypeptidase regulatory-like domain-containing protein [Steroidobacteraceae bacterium]
MNRTHVAFLGGLTSAALCMAPSVVLAQGRVPSETPSIVGTIHDSRGEPLAGAAISAQATDQMFSTSVYTGQDGRYVLPHLTAGRYRLWAQDIGYVTARSELTVAGSHTMRRDLDLKPLQNYDEELTGYDWFNSLPATSRDQRRLKQAMFVTCTGCHGLDVVLQNRFSEAGWNKIIHLMSNTFYNGYLGDLKTRKQLRWEGQLIRYFQPELARYLAEVRGPDSPAIVPRPMPAPTGAAARAVFTEYFLPSQVRRNEPTWYYGQDWMLGPSTGMHGAVGVHDVVIDHLGIAWITQSRTDFETNRTLVRLDPQTGAMSNYKLTDPDGQIVLFEQINESEQGIIWLHSNGKWLVRLDPATEDFTMFRLPKVMGTMFNSTTINAQGQVFVNAPHGVVEFDPAQMHAAGVPYPGWHLWQQNTPGNGVTYGDATDSENNPWWSESYSDIVATREMKTGRVSEFPMRDPEYAARKALSTPEDLAFFDDIGAETWADNSAEPLPYSEMPRRMSADKTGGTVWVPMWASTYLAEINIHTHKVIYHRMPFYEHPYKTTVDNHHRVWADGQVSDTGVEFDPATQKWTVYQLPSRGCSSRHVFFDKVRGELWVPCDQANMVVRVQFRSPGDLRAQDAAAASSLGRF